MADTRLILGGITFQGFEIPEQISFGGKQTIHKHALIGGERVLDVMGPDPSDIPWRGQFRGPSARSRALAIDAMRQSGAEVALSWGGLFYMVVVASFRADYRKAYEIPYNISCTVSRVNSSNAILASVTALIDGDLRTLGALAGAL